MGGASIWHWIVVGLLVVLLFGRGKISEMMGDVAKGIKAFKKGMTEDDTATAASTSTTNAAAAADSEPVRSIEHQSAGGTATSTTTTAGDRRA